jgi:hypothetical protein
MPHLFVDISSHGFGHLAQTGPVLNALVERLPALRLSIRSALPAEQLRLRIGHAFDYFHGASDVAFLMHDAVRVDREASAAAYREAHADWPARVAAEAEWLAGLAPDLVLSNVSCLPLAGARRAGIPALAMCSLNWADQFDYLFAGEAWAEKIHADLLAAYAGADFFLRCMPAMPMPNLGNTQAIPPLSCHGQRRREALEKSLGSGPERLVLVVMGGIGFDMPVGNWPPMTGIRWLVREPLCTARDDVTVYPALGLHFSDLLANVDAVVTKPGYGMFVESAAAGTPVLYLRREDWPEQEVLIDWLRREAVCAEVSAEEFSSGRLMSALDRLWQLPHRRVGADGAIKAASLLEQMLKAGS